MATNVWRVRLLYLLCSQVVTRSKSFVISFCVRSVLPFKVIIWWVDLLGRAWTKMSHRDVGDAVYYPIQCYDTQCKTALRRLINTSMLSSKIPWITSDGCFNRSWKRPSLTYSTSWQDDLVEFIWCVVIGLLSAFCANLQDILAFCACLSACEKSGCLDAGIHTDTRVCGCWGGDQDVIWRL